VFGAGTGFHLGFEGAREEGTLKMSRAEKANMAANTRPNLGLALPLRSQLKNAPGGHRAYRARDSPAGGGAQWAGRNALRKFKLAENRWEDATPLG
jgi:hypothetical protein